MNIFKELREKARLTKADASRELGVFAYRINNWENDRAFPIPDMLVRISKLYGCSVEYMIENSEYAKKIPRLNNINFFRKLRLDAGLTQYQVRTLLNVSQYAIDAWEHGRTHPHPKKIVRIAEVYGCSEDEIISNLPRKVREAYKRALSNPLVKLRLRIGMSQCEVADKLDIEQTSMSAWECGRSKPKKSNRELLAELYGCSIEEIDAAIDSIAA